MTRSFKVKARHDQVWKSLDPRVERWVRVESVDSRYAYVRTCGSGGEWLTGARYSRILLDATGGLTRYVYCERATAYAPVWY